MIRPSRPTDVPRCLELLEAAHHRSRYATLGSVDIHKARDLIKCLQARVCAQDDDKSFFWVAEKSGRVQGFLVGVVQPIYLVFSKQQATDVFTLIDSQRADPADFVKLVTKFREWAFRREDVIEILAGLSDVMGKDWQRLIPIYQRLGFVQSGVMMTYRQAA